MYGNLSTPCYVYGRITGEGAPCWHLLTPRDDGWSYAEDGRRVTVLKDCYIVPVEQWADEDRFPPRPPQCGIGQIVAEEVR